MDNKITSTQLFNALYSADLLPNRYVDLAVPSRTEASVLIGYIDSDYELVRTEANYSVRDRHGNFEFGMHHVSLGTAFHGLVDLLRANENRTLDELLCEMSL